MYEPFEELKRAEREEDRQEGKLEAVSNLMVNLQFSIEKALDVLGIPETEWEKYLEEIKRKEQSINSANM